MAKLIDVDIPDVADKKAKTTIPTVYVHGDAVARYNEARELVDKGTVTMNELKPTLLEAGIAAVFEHNCAHAGDTEALISSVKLMDKLPDDADAIAPTLALKEAVMCTWTKKNGSSDASAVEAEFKHILTTAGKKPNVNNYYGFELVGTFDTSVFKMGGKFSQERYDAFVAALQEVSDTFGVDNPLSCAKQWTPKPDFHERRWQQFDVKTNLALQAVLPTQVNLKPIRPAKPE